MIEQLAKNRDPVVIAELEQTVDGESVLHLGSDAVDQLSDFHAAIARLSGDHTLQIVSDMLHHVIEKANRSLQPIRGARAEQAVPRSAKTHRMVLDMIKSGDPEKAGELGERHLQKAEEFVLTGAEMSTVVELLE